MAAAGLLVLLAIGVLLVPDLRASPGTWIFSGVLVVLAVLRLTIGLSWAPLRTARQHKYYKWWGYGSHDGTGERDMREKRGE